MKVLVTGANGFVGKHLVGVLNACGVTVVAPSSRELDISKPFKLSHHFNAVVHLAAYNVTSIGDKSETMYENVNVLGTKHVAESVSCDQFVFLSTLKIYDEPLSAYAKSKAKAEEMCRRLCRSESLVFIRSANVWGPGQAPKAVLPVFIEQARQNLPIHLTANPMMPIDYIDVRDLVQVILKILERPKSSGVYHAAYPKPVFLEDLALKVIAACGSSSQITSSVIPSVAAERQVDCVRTWEELDFKPRYDVDRVIAHILS